MCRGPSGKGSSRHKSRRARKRYKSIVLQRIVASRDSTDHIHTTGDVAKGQSGPHLVTFHNSSCWREVQITQGRVRERQTQSRATKKSERQLARCQERSADGVKNLGTATTATTTRQGTAPLSAKDTGKRGIGGSKGTKEANFREARHRYCWSSIGYDPPIDIRPGRCCGPRKHDMNREIQEHNARRRMSPSRPWQRAAAYPITGQSCPRRTITTCWL